MSPRIDSDKTSATVDFRGTRYGPQPVLSGRLSRRDFLTASSAAIATLPVHAAFAGPDRPNEKSVACIVTEYRTNSHADVLVGKLLEGYDQQGGPRPALRVASMFTDQVPANDLSRPLAAKHNFPLFDNIERALTLGTDRIAVDGVLLVGEHGQYPYNVKGQHCYPRLRFFEDTVAVFRKYGRVIPVFNDKHLAYNWHDAAWMYDTSRELKMPFLAGSSMPLTYRRSALTLPLGCELEGALAVARGNFESYGFHALEMLQCMVERRKGGERGVVAVQALQGEAMFQALERGRWQRGLLEAALAVIPDNSAGKVEDNCRDEKRAAVYLIEYADGLQAAVAMLNGHVRHFSFCGKIKGRAEPLATWFYTQPAKPFAHFAYLAKAIEQLVQTGRPPYPVERTLLTTGILDAAMTSLFLGQKRIETPHLAKLSYQPADYPYAPLPDLGVQLL